MLIPLSPHGRSSTTASCDTISNEASHSETEQKTRFRLNATVLSLLQYIERLIGTICLFPVPTKKNVLDRKWKKLTKKSTLSKGSVLLLRSTVLDFTLFREFGLDYGSSSSPKIKLVASMKNLNSSSFFWFYCRPNPGSHTHL